MIEQIFNNTGAETLSVASALFTVVSAAIMGILICITYMKTSEKGNWSQNFILTLMMIAPIIAIIILLVGSNVARAFSLAGAFSIIRFRSDPGDPKDIAYIFFTLAAGLACGVGLVGYGAVFTLFLCGVALFLHLIGFGRTKDVHKQLKILIPENLNYSNAFGSVFGVFTEKNSLDSIRSKEMGSVFELCYDVVLKKGCEEKEFLDAIRCRNGNLTVMITSNIERSK